MMKLSLFPAAFYGLSSSTTTSSLTAFNNYHRRCLIRSISTRTTATKSLQPARCFQIWPLASHDRRGFHHRLRNRHQSPFQIYSVNDDTIDIPRITQHQQQQQQQQQHHATYQRRRRMSLYSTANDNNKNTNVDVEQDHPGDTTRTAFDADISATIATATSSVPLNTTATTEYVNNYENDEESSTSVATGSKPKPPNQNQKPTFRLFYNDVYEVKLPPKHRFPMGKYRRVRERVQEKITNLPRETKDSVDCDFRVSPLSTVEELSTTHDPTYIQRFLEGDQTELEQRNVGFPWSPSGVDRALSSVGGTLAAACFVCDHERERQRERERERNIEEAAGAGASVKSSDAMLQSSTSSMSSKLPAWAAHVAGGTHHAFYDYGEGFSVFSDMAVTANVVLDKYPDIIQNNILMIDLDVHQGNGNAVLFQQPKSDGTSNSNSSHSSSRNNGDETTATATATANEIASKPSSKHADRVFTFSMHCSGNYFSEKQKSDLDIELPIGCKDQAYLMTLNHWLKRFKIEHQKACDEACGNDSDQTRKQEPRPYKWDLIIFQAGVDVLDDDRLGRMALSPKGVARRNELVYEFALDLGVPLVICMGGGYPKRDDAWESIIETHSEVYVGAHRFLSSLPTNE